MGDASAGQIQKELMAEHYARVNDASSRGIPVVYVTATFPVELIRAFEPRCIAVYPENHAVYLIVRGLAPELAEVAIQRQSVDRMGCSYELANTGYLSRLQDCGIHPGEDAGVPTLPPPDILLACNNQCDVVAEWYQDLSRMFGNKPLGVVNSGNRYDGKLEQIRVDYVRDQLVDVIRLLEEATGSTLDRDYLLEVARRSNQAVGLWKEYLDMGRLEPSPITAFDGFYHMALIVSERGTSRAVDYYHKLVDETREAVSGGKAAVEPEKHRLLWDNLATWFNFGKLKRQMSARGIAVVGSTYLDIWTWKLDDSSYENLLTSMAEAYSSVYTNLTIGQRIELWKKMVIEYGAEGVLFHDNRSCHTFSWMQGQIAGALKEEFGEGFKTILFEGDMGLSERFHEHKFNTAIETYFENT